MSNFKIISIEAENFKGFPKLDIKFTGTSVVLGGMNGFGKTTIFDAIELVLTGKISRMAEYSEKLHNHTYSRSQSRLPLVCDMTCKYVSLTLHLELGGESIKIRRCANVSEMKNPVDFAPFSPLQIYDPKILAFRNISIEEREHYGLVKLKNDYSFLNYLSQEEATAFLKHKDSERSNIIQNLFDTKSFDEPIEKISKIIVQIDKTIRKLTDTSQSIAKEIEQFSKLGKESASECDEYISLTTDNASWDVVNPKMSHEEFNSFVAKDGVFDGLLYYVNNEDSFKRFNRNNIINKLLGSSNLKDLLFFLKYQGLEKEFNRYLNVKRKIVNPIQSLTSETLISFHLDPDEDYPECISQESIRKSNEYIAAYKSTLMSVNALQRTIQDILSQRSSFAQKVIQVNPSLHFTSCPLCGVDYKDENLLQDNIKSNENVLNNHFKNVYNGLAEHFKQVKDFLDNQILTPLVSYFSEKGITDDLVSEYKRLDVQQVKKTKQYLERFNIGLSISDDINNDVIKLSEALRSQLSEVDGNLNVPLMQRMYTSYVVHIERTRFTVENIERKRKYLIGQWNQLQTELLKAKHEELLHINKAIDAYRSQKDKLKKLSGEINQQRNQFVTKVITDIQTLFYVYSGRILQDSYFGRGLFLKPDLRRNRILFVSGSYEDNDVDALYNMSSGQLVGVAISFLLSLNRLYSGYKIVAIDDPVQTIDDINLWGLMETLRHDFKDRFILLSTHEQNYGQLLHYKFQKVGIKSEYIDMAIMHQ